MKQLFYSFVLLAGICSFSACSNGDYSANPASNVNNAVNPLNPLKSSEFTWSGDVPLSADINGTHWKADEATWSLDDSGANVIVARGGGRTMYFRLADVWSGSVYDMGYNNIKRYSIVSDSSGINHTLAVYRSDLDNSGEIKIIENDSSVIQGQFYYKGYNGNGLEVNVANGYMKIVKQ